MGDFGFYPGVRKFFSQKTRIVSFILNETKVVYFFFSKSPKTQKISEKWGKTEEFRLAQKAKNLSFTSQISDMKKNLGATF